MKIGVRWASHRKFLTNKKVLLFMFSAGPIPLRIREARVPIVNDNECVRKINTVTEKIFILPASSFCAGGEKGHDACQVLDCNHLDNFTSVLVYIFVEISSHNFQWIITLCQWKRNCNLVWISHQLFSEMDNYVEMQFYLCKKTVKTGLV